ncbi:Fic family protein [Methylobacter sp. G7]|uniref:Fic family protein n=1 Tax=Methylobacter sp. G7 TaxID=3230117 RepID=UPI003D807451
MLLVSMSREQLQQQLGLADRKSFRQAYLQPALEQGLIEMTLPDKPQSKLQQYRITPTGKAVLQRIKQDGVEQ